MSKKRQNYMKRADQVFFEGHQSQGRGVPSLRIHRAPPVRPHHLPLLQGDQMRPGHWKSKLEELRELAAEMEVAA